MTYPNIKNLAARERIVLGSASPRRAHLLGETGIEFEIVAPNLEEARLPSEQPYDYALRLAKDKALVVSARCNNKALILGCDTIVVLGNEVIEKPDDKKHAFEMLSRLSGREHTVCSAISLCRTNKILASGYELTVVRFNRITDNQIREYIESGEPMDKAGAYGIQGIGGFLVDTIEGNLDTVIGFPRTLLERLAADVLKESRSEETGKTDGK